MTTEGPPLVRLVRDPQVVFDTMIPVAWAVAGHGATLRYAFRGRAIIPGRVYAEIDGHSYSTERARAGEMIRPTNFARRVEVPAEDRPTVIRRMEGWTSIERVADEAEGIDVFTSIHVLYALVIKSQVRDCVTAWGVYMSLEATGLWAVADYPYDAVGQARFLAKAADVEAAGVRWRARNP